MDSQPEPQRHPLMPTNKVSVGVVAGAVTGLIVFALQSFTTVKIDADTAIYISTVVTFVMQYITEDK